LRPLLLPKVTSTIANLLAGEITACWLGHFIGTHLAEAVQYRPRQML
jgi:hypothetical protein